MTHCPSLSNWMPFLMLAIGMPPGAIAQGPPRVRSLQPPDQAIEVDAIQCTRLVVTFDQEMDRNEPAIRGGTPGSPRVLGSSWADARTFTLEVELQAERVYVMDLGFAPTGGFRSATGRDLPPTQWRFATTGGNIDRAVAEQATARLFAAIASNYSYADRLGVDWNDLEQNVRDELHSAPTMQALALRMSKALAIAQDSHLTIRWLDAVVPTLHPVVQPNFDLRGLQRALPRLQRVGRSGMMARTDDGVGYLLFPSFAREHSGDFELLLAALRTLRDCKAIVIDVRPNAGGDDTEGLRLASFFAGEEQVYAAYRVRDPRGRGFLPNQERTIRGNPAPDVFKRPVAVLMGPQNLGAAESFLLMMKQAPNAVLVGADSYGSSGNPRAHQLERGLSVMLPSWQALRPDGTCFEGEGIAPHVSIAASSEELRLGDPVLEAALQRLRNRR